jgi:lipopolysaccharide/colanic/teichoic acid biosynthesis glycosyltransferase
MPSGYDIAKRAFDVVVSASALVATAPITIPTAIAIRLTMGSPVLFRQVRPGKDSVPFELLKFRTMRNLQPGESMLATDADRITRLGKFLRETSIDEFPTFINVLRGEMSVVGPRPLLMRYLDRYTPRQARRHDVKPGITGLAAVMGRNALNWEERFEYDVEYVERQSFLLDLEIIARTIWVVLRREGISAEGAATMHEFMGTQAAEAA